MRSFHGAATVKKYDPRRAVEVERLHQRPVVRVIGCHVCLQQGEWPSREQDVEEVDVDKLKAMVHVKDEDIYGLDKYVAPPKGTP